MLLVTEQVPAPPGALLAASSAPEGHLLVAFDACVASYAATTAPGAAAGNGAGLRRLWHQPVGGGRVQFAAPLAPDAYLLVTRSSSSPGMAHAVVVQVLPTGQHVCTAVDLACSEGHEQPCQRPAFSNLAPCGDGTYMLVAALWQATAHVLHAQQGPGGTWRLTATPSPLGELLTAEPGSVLAVTSLALGPASAQFAPGGRLHVVLLYSSHRLGSGGLAAVQHVACLELQPEDGALHRCCWFLRNVCPTTSLVAPLPGARTLVAAQTSLMVVHADAPHSKQQAAVGLNGSPTAAAALSQNAVVLSDSSGQLLLLDLQSLAATPVATTSLTAGPSCLALLPHPACGTEPAGPADSEQEQCCAAPPAGLLFVGSGGGVLLEVLAAALAGGPAAAEAAAAVGWRVAGGGDGGEGFGSCLAPVAFGQLVPDPSGCDDARLLAGCGEAPFGRLALGRLAAGLTPLAVGSAELPGWVRLLSLKASPAAARHRFLLLTSDEGAGAAGAWTSVLETGEDGLQAAELPGLQTSSATLAAAPLAGGCILQVTPQGAHVFMPGTGEALSSWAPPSGSAVTLAAQHGQHVALACGATVHLLYCSGSGRLQEERHLSLPQQASALTLFRLGTDGRTEGELWLATGLWVANEVLLQPLSRDQPACRLALGSRQCRSVLACSLGSSSSSGSSSGGGEQPAYLIVGSSSGELLWWRLDVQQDAFGAASSVQLHECGAARVGLAPVVLHLLPPDPAAAAAAAAYCSGDSSMADSSASPCVLAVSDQALLLQPDPVHPSRLAPLRLHGGQGLSAVCPLLAADLPGSRLAYTRSGQLAIAGLDAEAQLRWDELALTGGAAATSAAFHAANGCAAVGCMEVDGSSSLRLVDVVAMRELGRVPLASHHTVTALAVLPLACSSSSRHAGSRETGGAAALAAQRSQQAPGCDQFLVVAVAEDGSAGMPAEPHQPAAAGGAADQPWWRQPQQQGDADAQDAASSLASIRGRLLFYQWRQGQEGGGAGHGLVLQGSCPLPAAAFSLATVLPELQPYERGGPAVAGPASPRSSAHASGTEEHPLLAAGCDDGTVRLFRVFVDDAGMEAHHAVEQGLAAIAAAVEPLRLAESSGTGTSEPSAGPAPEQAAADAGDKGSTASSSRQQHLWHQQVALQLLAKAPTCFQGVPASLSVQGTILFARDLLSSLTAYRVQPLAAGQPPTLLPLADDLSGRHLTAALPLTETAVLAGAPEGSLLLLQRDPAAEHSRQAAAKQQFEQTLEAGGGVAAGAAAAQRFTPTLRHAAQLDTVASCELGGSVVEVLPGLMGVPVCPMAELLGGSGSGSSSSQHQPTATAVCSNGTVAAVRLLTPQAHAVLMQLQRAALATSYVEAGDGAATAKLRLSGTGTGTHEGCIDGSSLAAAFTSRSWYARLVKAAPAATIQQGRALLESFGLL